MAKRKPPPLPSKCVKKQYVGYALFLYDDGKGESDTDEEDELDFAGKDCIKLDQLFGKKFLYYVRKLHGCDKKSFKRACESVKNFKTYDRILVYFSGHGKNGAIVLNGEEVLIKEMISWFNDDSLKDTIRMFFIDACRFETEEESTREEPTNANRDEFIGEVEGIFVAYSCLPSSIAYGISTDTGSFWTNCLCQALQQSEVKDSVHDVLIETNRMLKKELINRGKTQIPEYIAQGLQNNVYFKKEAIREETGYVHYCKHLKSYYSNGAMEPTKWSKLGGPSLIMNVSIIKCSAGRYHEDFVTVDKILSAGYKKSILIEGDPGAGKTTVVNNICNRWVKGELTKDLVLLVPLRDIFYQKVTNLKTLFDKLGCPEMDEYARQNNGDGLVFILDGLDELPKQRSLYHDLIFKKSPLVTFSTIIVTSRPSCSDQIAEAVQDHYYRILGFASQTVQTYIKEYFKDNQQYAESLIGILSAHLYLRLHFYIPLTVVIMCVVYSEYENHLPKTLSRLYEKFVLLCVCHYCYDNNEEFELNSLLEMPEKLKLLFSKLCKKAYDMLANDVLTFEEKDVEGDLHTNPDGFGLLSIEHVINEYGKEEKHYSFIHRAVQELMAAISVIQLNRVENVIDKHFCVGSFCINIFPFIFGLMSESQHTFLGEKLRQKFADLDKSDISKMFLTILHCLFEAQDKTLCHEFGKLFGACDEKLFSSHDEKLFSEKRISFRNLGVKALWHHYAGYFLSNCGCKYLHVTDLAITDTTIEIIAQHLGNSSSGINHELIICLECIVSDDLSEKGMQTLTKVLASQHRLLLLSVHNYCGYVLPSSYTKIMFDGICQQNSNITHFRITDFILNEESLNSLGCLIATLDSLQYLYLAGSFAEGVSLKSSRCFSNALCYTTTLNELTLWTDRFSYIDSREFSGILSHNSSIRKLHIKHVDTDDCLGVIFGGLSLNRSVKTFRSWPKSISRIYSGVPKFAQWFKNTESNCFLKFIDFAECPHALFYNHVKPNGIAVKIVWSSSQVCSFCTILQSNTTLVTLDISGCYIDKEASFALCIMLLQNASLKHLFLNPAYMEKSEAIAIIDICNTNKALEVLSLYRCQHTLIWFTDVFIYANDPEINFQLDKVRDSRESEGEPILKVIWELKEYEDTKKKLCIAQGFHCEFSEYEFAITKETGSYRIVIS